MSIWNDEKPKDANAKWSEWSMQTSKPKSKPTPAKEAAPVKVKLRMTDYTSAVVLMTAGLQAFAMMS